MKVLVLMGGVSMERDVSLESGRAVVSALQAKGHEVTAVDTAENNPTALEHLKAQTGNIKTTPPDLTEMARYDRQQNLKLLNFSGLLNTDVVFLALHGGTGEDGSIQALLDLADIKYTGSKMLSSAIAMNKAVSKKLFKQANIPTPEWMLVYKKDYDKKVCDEIINSFEIPVIVKPNDQGSTVGLSLVEHSDYLEKAIELAFSVSDEVLIEQFIAGREMTVAVLDNQPLPVVEIMPKNKLYDYESKYTAGMCSYQCPAQISSSKTNELQELGLRAFQALNCSGYARVDFRMNAEDGLFCLEVNTLPGMTATSLVPKAALSAGINFADLIDKIIKLAVSS